MIGIVLAALAGAKLGGDQFWYTDEPKWKAMASSVGGGILGALAGWAAAPAAVGGVGSSTAAPAAQGAAQGVGTGAAVATQAAVTTAQQAATAAAEASLVGSEEAALLAAMDSAPLAAETVAPTVAESVMELGTEEALLAAAEETGKGAFEAAPNVGLDVPNTTGMDEVGLFESLPQYQQYGSVMDQLGSRADQLSNFWDANKGYLEDAMQVYDQLSPEEQQQQQTGMPAQSRGGLDDQATAKQDAIDSEILSRQLGTQNQFMTKDMMSLSGVFSPLGETNNEEAEYDEPGNFDMFSVPSPFTNFDYNSLLGDNQQARDWNLDTMFNI